MDRLVGEGEGGWLRDITVTYYFPGGGGVLRGFAACKQEIQARRPKKPQVISRSAPSCTLPNTSLNIARETSPTSKQDWVML